MSHAGPRQGLVLIDRGDYWQCGYVITKGTVDALKDGGIGALRARIAEVAPLPADRFEGIRSWDDVHLLSVRIDRLEDVVETRPVVYRGCRTRHVADWRRWCEPRYSGRYSDGQPTG